MDSYEAIKLERQNGSCWLHLQLEGTLYICHLTRDNQYQDYKPYASDKLMQALLFYLIITNKTMFGSHWYKTQLQCGAQQDEWLCWHFFSLYSCSGSWLQYVSIRLYWPFVIGWHNLSQLPWCLTTRIYRHDRKGQGEPIHGHYFGHYRSFRQESNP